MKNVIITKTVIHLCLFYITSIRLIIKCDDFKNFIFLFKIQFLFLPRLISVEATTNIFAKKAVTRYQISE